MGKRGQTKHMKRIAIPASMGIKDKKSYTWISKPNPGTHDGKHTISLAVLLRDILKVCKTNKEAKNMLNKRNVMVDGRIRTDEKFPIGLMDIVSLTKEGKYYRLITESHGRLIPVEIEEKEASEKIGKVVGKYTGKKGEISISTHDGKSIKADNNVKVGDSIVVSVPENKIKKILKMEQGAICFIKGGKHAGRIASVEEIIQKEPRSRGKAKMKSGKDEFITVMDHLCVVDDRVKEVAQ